MSSGLTIAHCSPFIPPEWVAAHGVQPVWVSPSAAVEAGGLDAAGVCAYTKAFVSEVCAGRQAYSAVLFTTTCDQMRRAAEYVQQTQSAPVFLMTIPATWQTTTAVALYRQELQRLGRFLVHIGGRAPSDAQLAEQADEFDRRRQALRDRRGLLDGASFAEHLREFQTTNQLPDFPADFVAPECDAVRLALAGGPLSRDEISVFERVRRVGGEVVLDATESGEMTLPPPFSRRELRRDPFGEIVDAYFGQIPHAMRRPNSQLYRYFQRELAARQVQGVIWQQPTWCDIWAAEAQRFSEWCSIPVLQWDTGDERADQARLTTRLEAFVEMLR